MEVGYGKALPSIEVASRAGSVCTPEGCATASYVTQVRGWGVAGANKFLPVVTHDNPSSGNEQALAEMQNFLAALDLYAERFARDPNLTFAEHYAGLFPVTKAKRAAVA